MLRILDHNFNIEDRVSNEVIHNIEYESVIELYAAEKGVIA